MARSRKRKLLRVGAHWTTFPLASTALFAANASQAQDAETGTLEEVVVTAQKRSEDLQKVPISLTVLAGEKLEELQLGDFSDYAKFLPSLEYSSTGPGQAELYFRGTSSGAGRPPLHAGSLPTSGLYIDEIPATTIGNSLDLHIYDIARVEALAGPQGTLYGASSLAGTLRIITNKPDPTQFSAGYDVKGDTVKHGDSGGSIEGFVNVPLSDNLAVRLVGYYEHDPGYIDIAPFAVTYQRENTDAEPPLAADPLTRTNDTIVRKNANDTDSIGGRVALKYDLNDQWTMTPQVVYQHQNANGNFGFEPHLGTFKVGDFFLGRNRDRWYQSQLTIEGKISNFDVLYSGGYFERHVDNLVDYSQYSIAYDQFGTGYSVFTDDAGNLVDPTQYTANHDKYTKMSHELRVTSPAEYRLRGTIGAFYQRQTDNIRVEYRVDGIGEDYSVTANPGILYLSAQDRTDRDYALFTELSYDLTDRLKLTGGIRKFWVNNTLYGFFGYNNRHYAGSDGEFFCEPDSGPSRGRPCVNTDSKVVENGETHKISLQFQATPDAMIYGTYSTGFRPGGNNRRLEAPPFGSDRLRNLEAGWKTSWLDQHLRVNGAVFFEKWTGVQFSIQGANGINSIYNIGDAKMKGIEGDIVGLVGSNLVLSLGGTYVDAKTKSNFCQPLDSGAIVTDCATPASAAGTRLPNIPKLKTNATARYKFDVGQFASFVQGAAVYLSSSTYRLENARNDIVGKIPQFTSFDFSVGTGRNHWTLEAFVENAFDREGTLFKIAQCKKPYCDENSNSYSIRPQTLGIRFGQKF